MTRILIICVLFAIAYITWTAVYLLPYTRDEVLSDANLQRAFNAAIRY